MECFFSVLRNKTHKTCAAVQGKGGKMANIQKRVNSKGKTVYRVQVRLKGAPAERATFSRLTDAKKWATKTEADIRAGRHVKNVEAKRRTVREMIDRYELKVLPQ